jgi:hypothetical protein
MYKWPDVDSIRHNMAADAKLYNIEPLHGEFTASSAVKL